MFGNVRSISKQYQELLTCVKYLREYRDACALYFNENWLNPDIAESVVELQDFKLFRGDKTIVPLGNIMEVVFVCVPI